jgi:hypothetical protein
MQQLRGRKTYSAVLQRDRPMSETIPLRKPPSKPKEDDETAEFLKLLDIITKPNKRKALLDGGAFLLLLTDEPFQGHGTFQNNDALRSLR